MSGLAVVGGNSLIGSDIGADAPELTVDDGTRAVVVRDLGDAYLLQRHGWGGYTAPHLVDHVANLRALVALGCDRILAINSSGSLRTSFGVGTFVLADDFVAFGPDTEHLHRRARPPRARVRHRVARPHPRRLALGHRRSRCTTAACTGRRSGPGSRPRPRSACSPSTPTWSG